MEIIVTRELIPDHIMDIYKGEIMGKKKKKKKDQALKVMPGYLGFDEQDLITAYRVSMFKILTSWFMWKFYGKYKKEK